MGSRKSLSKTLRFEIFKRDGFVCQYCGAHPPAVVLEIDHINPKIEGGLDDQGNLVTSCFNCNRGKGRRKLSNIPQSLSDQAGQIADREEQLRGYHEIIQARRARIEAEAQQVNAIYEDHVGGYTLTDRSLMSVKMFIEKLGVFPVMEAMEFACIQWEDRDVDLFRYFCGVCWNKIRDNK